jgi:hypothetical protein
MSLYSYNFLLIDIYTIKIDLAMNGKIHFKKLIFFAVSN